MTINEKPNNGSISDCPNIANLKNSLYKVWDLIVKLIAIQAKEYLLNRICRPK